MRGILRAFPGRRSSWAVLAVWGALVVVFGPLGAKVADITNEEYVLPESSDTVRVQKILATRFPGGDERPAIVVYRHEGGLTAADKQRILVDARELNALERIGQPVAPFAPGSPPGLVSANGDVAFTILPIQTGKVFHVTPTIEAIRSRVEGPEPLEVHVTGWSAFLSDYNSAIREADFKLLGATVLLVLLLLIAVYRSPILALVPLVTVGVAFSVASGIIYVLNRGPGLPVDSASTSLLLVLMFGAGTDYCLLLVSRYGAQLRRTESARDALRQAIPQAVPPMVASGLTVIAALLTTLAGVFGFFRTLGPVNAIGIAVVLLAGITLLPAILSLLGRRAYWPSTASVAPTGEGEPEIERGRWRAVGERVRRSPGSYLALAVAFLLAAAAGLGLWKTQIEPVAQFRSPTDSTRGYDVLKSAFPPGAIGPTWILVERPLGAVQSADLAAVSTRVSAVEGVLSVRDTGRRSTDGHAALLSMTYADNPFTPAAISLTDRIRDDVADVGPGLNVLLAQGSAERADLQHASIRDTKVIMPLALAVVLLTLIVLLRALVAPLFLLATVVLSFAATLGLCVVIFKFVFGQDGFSSGLPVVIFIFLVALGSDYNIFLMSRVREEATRHGTRVGTLNALTATGPVITSAGLILAGTFAVLTIIPSWDLTLIGFAVALGVLLDTFLVRSICVPALTWLFGERSWWPSSAEQGRRATVVTGVYTTEELLGVKFRSARSAGGRDRSGGSSR